MVSSLQPDLAFPRRHRRLPLPQQIIRYIEIECGAVDIVQALIVECTVPVAPKALSLNKSWGLVGFRTTAQNGKGEIFLHRV